MDASSSTVVGGDAQLRRRRGSTTEPSSSTMPVNIRRSVPARRVARSMRRSSPTCVDAGDAAAPHVVDGRRAGPGEQRAAVVAAGERRREVHDVAVDQPGPVEGAGDGRPALDQHLQHALGPEGVEHLAEVAGELEGRAAPWRRRRPGPSTTRSGWRSSGVSTWRTVRLGSSARTVPAPTSTASLSARSRWASARASGPVIHWLEPSGAAVRPSRVAASLRTT